jgi:hypothetical protein
MDNEDEDEKTPKLESDIYFKAIKITGGVFFWICLMLGLIGIQAFNKYNDYVVRSTAT